MNLRELEEIEKKFKLTSRISEEDVLYLITIARNNLTAKVQKDCKCSNDFDGITFRRDDY